MKLGNELRKILTAQYNFSSPDDHVPPLVPRHVCFEKPVVVSRDQLDHSYEHRLRLKRLDDLQEGDLREHNLRVRQIYKPANHIAYRA